MRITITHDGKVSEGETDDGPPIPQTHIDVDYGEFRIDIEGVGEFGLEKLENLILYEGLDKTSKWRMWQIVGFSVLFLLLDAVLFFIAPFFLVEHLKLDIGFSPIPIGATISICGIQAACIAAMFYQFKEESKRVAYVFRGKEAYPSNREK